VQVLDVIFVVLFALEAVLKIVVKGFFFTGQDSYLRNAWNGLDFAVVISGEGR
jgi:hypothetical protein